MSKDFGAIYIHTLIRKLQQTNFQTQSLSSSKTASRDAKPTQHIEIIHHHNVNSKLAFHRWHPVTNTIQHLHCIHTTTQSTSSWYMQTISPSHLHTQARVQPRNTYNHTCIKFLTGQNKTTSFQIQTNNLHSVHSRPCRI